MKKNTILPLAAEMGTSTTKGTTLPQMADWLKAMVIFADPYDRHDDNKDGMDWFNAQRFYYMWYDALLFDKVMKQIYITATPSTY